tara:strand:+ start:90 stop:1196 length:1107 start_codon:yes stop_codon:yes gene_type:complete
MNEIQGLQIYRSDKLRLARLAKGLSLDNIGSILNVTRQNVSKMESGQEPKDSQFELLCKELGVEKSFFYSERGAPVVEEQCHFRSIRTRTKTITNTVMARAEILTNLISEIESYYDLNDFRVNFDNDFENINAASIEKLSDLLRREWELGLGPISDITIVLENAGVIITTVDGVDEKVDAFSLSTKRPIIIRNNAKNNPCRYRFDLAHELGHLIMHEGIDTGCKLTEKQANYFASAFLMPKVTFSKAIESFPITRGTKSLNWKNIYKLKLYFKVSFKALLFRAKTLGLVSEDQMRSGYMYINKKGWAKGEPLDEQIPFEQPALLESMINGIGFGSWKRVLVKLGLTGNVIKEFLPDISFPENKLRAVK